ncbi:MAG TPA: hypothetical protein VFI65_05260 [Streptosporangiaceae bacterium]|nr:hypothetical protein [Streptosporangiaceae bacterium]
MPRWFPGVLSGHHIERGWRALGILLAVASLLELAAALGLASIAGFSQVAAVLGHFDWHWLLVLPAAWTVSYVGYYHAYRGIFRVRSGPQMRRRVVAAVALAGFGGFLAYRGGSLDGWALRAAGASEADAKVRVAALAGLEQGALALAGCGVAVTVLLTRLPGVPASATLAWALAPVPGLLIAFWLADRRCAGRLTGDSGWRSIMCTFLGSILMIKELFWHPLRWGSAIVGMTVFWLADAVAAWAGLAAFGYGMNAAALFIGFASGMVFSRRVGPLAGAGILALVLPLTISYCGAPLATAVAGVFAYRILSIWLQAPSWIAALPALRKINGRHDARRTVPSPIIRQPAQSALRD